MHELRAEFPVLERLAYLNTGSTGPVPRRAVEAASEALREQAEAGRADKAFFEDALALAGELRRRVAALLGCGPGDLALTASTTDGVNAVLNALELGPGDEVLTSDEEHPGVLAPLAGLRERRGVRVRMAPFGELAAAVDGGTRLVACSHVSWITGRVVDAEALAAAGAPLLLDGAQGLGAVPVDVEALRCDFYAAAGQKWLCGPNGSGYLYVRRERAEALSPAAPGYGSLAAPERPLDFELAEGALRFDGGFPAPHQCAWALAALDVLQGPSWETVHDRGAGLAAELAGELERRGARVAPRGRTTLVSWEVADPDREVEELRDRGVLVRRLPGTPYVRASVGAWSSRADLERLLG